jgi:hypothetical protein
MPHSIQRPFVAGALCVLALAAAPAAGDELVVCKSGCQYRTIGAAIKAAAPGDTVSVGPGTYAELVNFNGKDIVLRSQKGAEKTIIDAGFRGTAVSLHSGEGPAAVLDGFTVKRGGETGILIAHHSSPTVRNCIVERNLMSGIQIWESASKIEKVVVRDNFSYDSGAGIYIAGGSSSVISDSHIHDNFAEGSGGGFGMNMSQPTILRCKIENNVSLSRGGGVEADGGIPSPSKYTVSIKDSTIQGNYALNGGGGVFFYGDGIEPNHIENSLIVGNYSGDDGGGLYIENATPRIIDSVIADNYAKVAGGGVFVLMAGPIIQRCTIAGNAALERGGGLASEGGTGYPNLNGFQLRESTVSGNYTEDAGGGIHVDKDAKSPHLIVNSLVLGNFAGSTGGGIGLKDSSPRILASTIADNYGWTSGGGLSIETSGAPAVVNSILWGNLAGAGALPSSIVGGTPAAAYSDIEGGWAGEENSDVDPLFSEPIPAIYAPFIAGNYRIGTGSPCLDGGSGDTARFPGLPTIDFEGDARPAGSDSDMGADELSDDSAPLPVVSLGWVDPIAKEAGLDPAVFSATRSGTDLSAPLLVPVGFAGTATYGKDYEAFLPALVFPPGKARVLMNIVPINDGRRERRESIDPVLLPWTASAAGPPALIPRKAAALKLPNLFRLYIYDDD